MSLLHHSFLPFTRKSPQKDTKKPRANLKAQGSTQISKSPAAFYAARRKTKSQAQFCALRASFTYHCAYFPSHSSMLCSIYTAHPLYSALCNPFFVSLFLRFSLSGLYRWYGNLTRSASMPAPQIATANSKTSNCKFRLIINCKNTIIQFRRIKALGLIAQISCHCRMQNHISASLQIRMSASQNHSLQNCRRTNLQIRLPMQDIPRALPPVRNLTSP